jgi:type II secretory pathway pseudopilin PulG
MVKNRKKGFTLIEVGIVVALAVASALLLLPVQTNYYKLNSLLNVQKEMMSALNQAKAAAIANKNNSSFGVKFDDVLHTYTIFQGDSYSERVSELDEVFPMDPEVTISGIDEVVFGRGTGIVASSTVPGSTSWIVSFQNDHVYRSPKTANYFVRCVR